MGNIISLHKELSNKTYQHSLYYAFNISDPKPRNIHKAHVRDRLLHHAIYRKLYPVFDKKFIHDSYSCRLNKGTHRALNRFKEFGRIESRNNTRSIWILKCDIKKFFASIDHKILKEVLNRHLSDKDVCWLLGRVIDSFQPVQNGVGLPLGNLTSQLLVNIYMNELDQFVKRELKVKHYIRYADDFVILSADRERLEEALVAIGKFLTIRLNLSLHPNKVFIKTITSGVDFLGWIHFSNHRVIRTTTKRRMFKSMIASGWKTESVQSVLGLLSHGNSKVFREKILRFWETAKNSGHFNEDPGPK